MGAITKTSSAASGARTKDERVDVSVVLPVHNEVGHVLTEIERIHSSLEPSAYTYEIVVVDDGSTDGTLEKLRGLEGIRLLQLPLNRGCGNARRIGTRAALGDIVVWTDADMSYPNHEIAQLVDQLDDIHDQVVGARRTESGTHAWARRPAKWCIRRLASYLVRTPIPDLNSGFRAFRRDVARNYLHLLPDGFSCVTTITLAFLANGHAVRYVPIDYAERAGKSKFHWMQDTYLYLLQVIRLVMTFNPLRVFFPVGGVLMLVAIGKVLYDIITRDFWISANAIVLVVVALQVLAIGLLADLVSRLAGPRE